MAKDYGPCIIEHCENRRRKYRPTCALCGQNSYYWDKKVERQGAQVLRERQNNLEKWQDRMIHFGSQKDQPREVRDAARFIQKRRAN